jgi:hypothetical protein
MIRFEGLDEQPGYSASAFVPPADAITVARSFVELSLSIIRETRGPMRLWDFARRLERRLGMPRVPTGQLCEAIKAAVDRANDPRIALMSTSMPGVGYVYDAMDPDAKPVRSSR